MQADNKGLDAINNMQKNDPELKARFDSGQGTVAYIRGNVFGKSGVKPVPPKALMGVAESKAKEFINDSPDIFGRIDTSRLEIIHESSDADGSKNIILQQYHGQARVVGGSVRFRIRPTNMPDTISNRLFADLSGLPKKPEKTADQAYRIAKKSTGSKAEPGPAELVVVRHGSKPHLAWRIEFADPMTSNLKSESKHPMFASNSDLPENWVVYVDAISGAELLKYNNTQTAGPSTGKGQGYYSNYGRLNTWFNDVTYLLRDTTRNASGGPDIITNDYPHSSPSADPDNVWDYTINVPRNVSQGPEVDAHYYAPRVYQYFKDKHNYIGFDGAGGDFYSTVHYGYNCNNAFWTPGLNKAYFGDGDGTTYDYFTEDDIIAHEYVHGYTQFTCGLNYYGESGALNESFSDVFGSGFINNDWLCGKYCLLKNTAPALRNMIDPTCGGKWNVNDPVNSVLKGWQPSHYSVRYTGAYDNGGVHINSGIVNNLFYLLTEGGTHTVSHKQVRGIGQTASENMLWRCMRVNLVGKPNANFLDFREAMLDACQDLYPEDLFKLTQVKNAFNAVGIGPDIYIRDTLSDVGAEPYVLSSSSPDIIVRNCPSPDPSFDFGDFTKYFGQNVNRNYDNYLYVRLQNRGTSSGDATINIYMIRMGTFALPSEWIHIGSLFTSNIPAGGKRVCGPLIFDLSNIPDYGHYCLVAVATDPLDPAPNVMLINTLNEFYDYVRCVNNIAWCNTNVVNGVTPIHGTLEGFIGADPNEPPKDYSIRIDAKSFIPGAAIDVRGPSRFLDVATRQHMTGRIDNPNIPDGESSYGLDALPPEDVSDSLPGNGFDHVITKEKFVLAVDYALPKAMVIDKEYWLTVTQYYNNQRIGSFSLYFRPDSAATPRRVTMVKKDADGDILALCNPNETWWTEVSKARAISDIEQGRRTYWTAVQDGLRKDVIVVHDSTVRGGKYLRSSPDTNTPNNLDELPVV